MQAYEDQWVSLGDLIYLHEETSGTVGAEGFTDPRVCCFNGNDGYEFGRDCTFKLLPQQMYTMAKQLKQVSESLAPEKLAQLTEEARRERAHNESEVATSAGRSLRYGKIVQLQHTSSGSLVSVSPMASESNRDARRVLASETFDGEATWFKIMPKLRVHTEGEKVRSGDPVMLESVITGLRLHTSATSRYAHGRQEVNAFGEAAAFKIIIYRQHIHARRTDARGTVNGGDPIRIAHREADGFIGTSIARAKAGEDLCVLTDPGAAKSSAGLFIIEKVNPRDGSPCLWEESFRLRHVPSGMFLQVGTPNDYEDQTSREMGPGARGFFTAAQMALENMRGTGLHRERMRVVLTADDGIGLSRTLFHFASQYSSADDETSNARGQISRGQIFGVQHIDSGMWLHFDKVDNKPITVVPVAPEAGGVDGEGQVRRKSRGWGALKAKVTQAQGHGLINATAGFDTLGMVRTFIVATIERHDEDMFTVRPAPRDQYHDSLYILSRVTTLRQISSRIGEKKSGFEQSMAEAQQDDRETETDADLDDREAGDMKAAQTLLTELICFTTVSDNDDPFTREGLPIPNRQLLLTELQLLDLAIESSSRWSVVAEARQSADQFSTGNTLAGDTEVARMGTARGQYTSDFPSRSSTARDARRMSHSDVSFTMSRVSQVLRRRDTGLMDIANDVAKKRSKKTGAGSQEIQLSLLCQRLAWQILREHPLTKKYAVRFVPSLQLLLGKGSRAADTLREVFANNAEVLDMVTDDMIKMFIRLIRTSGRVARFVEFLSVLCSNEGKAVRNNQWRVCQMFILEAPELHVHLHHSPDGEKVMVRADAQYFPTFVGHDELELGVWLDTTTAQTGEYFKRCIELYHVLVAGRNVKNTQPLQDLLPYEVVLAIICDEKLHARHLGTCTQFVNVANSLYVDNEPHMTMARVRSMRIWDNVRAAAKSGKLSSRLVTTTFIVWSRFDELKAFIQEFLTNHAVSQLSTQMQVNRMSLQLTKLLYSLVEMGFYTSTEVTRLLPTLLSSLDGTSDRVGLHSIEDPKERYKPIKTIRADTVSIMECKLWSCKVLQLVVTMRLDIRLSLVLAKYQQAWQSGRFGNRVKGKDIDGIGKAVQETIQTVDRFRRRSLGYMQLIDSNDAQEEEELDTTPDPQFKRVFDVLRLDADSPVDIVHVLLDLTFYDHHELVTMAMGLLVRHFEQRQVLTNLVRETRLLVKPGMVKMHARFDMVLRSLSTLSKRRRLFDDEPYHATRLLSILTMNCYEETENLSAGAASQSGVSRAMSGHSRAMSGHSRALSGHSRAMSGANTSAAITASHVALLSDTTATYVHLVGKGRVRHFSSTVVVTMLEKGERQFRRGDRLEIEGKIYRIKTADPGSPVILEKKVELPDHGHPPNTDVEVWLFIESKASYHNADVQSLLHSMHAEEFPLQLLNLPFIKSAIVTGDIQTRAVLVACYRCLRAMASRFPLTQNTLVTHVPTFLAHTEAQLVSSDASPTECITSVYKDNAIVCTQVSEKMVRHFVQLAAVDHAPRYLRFLGMITLPTGRPARRCQNLVLQCLTEKEDALVLYNDESGMHLRAQLVEENDHMVNPRGRLAYHIELISLLARCIEGGPPMPVMQLRSLLPLGVLMQHMLLEGLPLKLKSSYLAIFDGAYLEGDNATHLLQSEEARDEMILVMDAQLSAIDRFVEDIAPVAAFEDSDEIDEADFIFKAVLTTVCLFYKNVYSRQAFGHLMDTYTRSLAHALLLLGQCSDQQPRIMLADAVAACLDAIHASGGGLVARAAVMDIGGLGTGRKMELGPFGSEPTKAAISARSRRTSHESDSATVSCSHMGAGGIEDSSTGGSVAGRSEAKSVRSLASRKGKRDRRGGVSRKDLEVNPRGDDMHPQEKLHDFALEIEAAMAEDMEIEQQGLVNVFMREHSLPIIGVKQARRASRLQFTRSRIAAPMRIHTSVYQLAESNEVVYTRNLIMQLQRGGSEVEGTLTALEVSQTVASMNVLITMCTQHTEVAALEMQQQLLCILGAPTVVLQMATCDDDQLCLKGLQLGCALLKGGNREVQDTMYEMLANPALEDKIRAFDGTPTNFVSQMRVRLRTAMVEIAERKTYLEVQDEMITVFRDDYAGVNTATLVALKEEIEKEFPQHSHVLDVLLLLQQLCEGHNNKLQDFLHVQTSAISNVDLVSEVYDFLARLEPEIDDSNIRQMQQCVDTLVEFVQGNMSQSANHFLLDTKLLEILDRLIQKPALGQSVGQTDLLKLQRGVALLLLALLEGTNRRVEERMLSVLDIRRLTEVALGLYERSISEEVDDEDDENQTELRELMVDVGFKMHMLVQHLRDYRDQSGSEQLESHALQAGGGQHRGRSPYDEFIARVEIINVTGELEYAYFRLPSCCVCLTEEIKQKLLWQVDRSTPGRQIQDFFDATEDLHQQMRHQESLNKSAAWRFLSSHREIAIRSMLVLALIQNATLMVRYSPVAQFDQYKVEITERAVNNILGVLQCISCVLVFALYGLQDGPTRVQQKWRQATDMGNAELSARFDTSRWFQIQYYMITPFYVLADGQLVFIVLCFVAAVLGLTFSAFFFSFHLLDMVNKSKDLQSVFHAVTLNGRSILMTAVFGFVIIYIYAIVGFAFGQDLFVAGDYPDPDIDWCTNLFVCWVSAVTNGLREGDIGKIMEPRPSDDARYPFMVLYQFSYYLIVITVLLNVIFGIIIDTFSELRTSAAQKTTAMENTCFICGVDRFTFETQGSGFKRHITEDHNMWNYLFMIVYLREMDKTEYNGWEQYVANKLKARDLSFFPVNAALVLKEHKERENRAGQEMGRQVMDVSQNVLQLSKAIERVEKNLNDRVDNITKLQESLQYALQAGFAQRSRVERPDHS